jgi:pyrroline-5-carboxylate reductase
MGEALLSGLLRSGMVAPSGVLAAVRREERARELREAYGIDVATAAAAAQRAQTLVITVKPQDMEALLAEIAPVVAADKLVISVAAGITTAFIEARLAAVSP